MSRIPDVKRCEGLVETGVAVRSLTIPVADDLYQRASQKAAAAETSLPEVVQDLLSEWVHESCYSANAVRSERKDADFLKFLDELAARPLKLGASVGPLNREELYERGVSGH